MSLNPPTYLASLKGNIRQRPVPWDGALRAGNLTNEQFSEIEGVKKADASRKERVEANVDGYRDLFLGGQGKPGVLESAGKNPKLVQYLLVLLGDLIQASTSLAKSAAKRSEDPYKHLLPLLAHSSGAEDPIPLLAATTASALMATAHDSSNFSSAALPLLLSYWAGLAKSSDAVQQDIAVVEFSTLLYGHDSRTQFWGQRSETVKPLVDILRTAAGMANGGGNSAATLWTSGSASVRSVGFEGQASGGVGLQLLYHCLLVLWQLSFEAREIGEDLSDEYDIIPLYTQLLRLSPKEKTTRLILSTLFNLLHKNQRTLLPSAALANLPVLLENLSRRHLTDPDLLEDLQRLRDMVDEHTKTKTNFDEYVAEVESGHLRPSPPHRNQVFWAENARRILDHENGAVLRKMAEIMSLPWDNDKNVLAIACNDIGFLVKEAPERRYQLEKFGLKTRIMQLMGDSDENVRWESLRALGGWLKYSFDSK